QIRLLRGLPMVGGDGIEQQMPRPALGHERAKVDYQRETEDPVVGVDEGRQRVFPGEPGQRLQGDADPRESQHPPDPPTAFLQISSPIGANTNPASRASRMIPGNASAVCVRSPRKSYPSPS